MHALKSLGIAQWLVAVCLICAALATPSAQAQTVYNPVPSVTTAGVPYDYQYVFGFPSDNFFVPCLGPITVVRDTSLGSLPPGLTLTSTGRLRGTPTTPGTYTFYFSASNTSNCSVPIAYVSTITIAPAPITISPTSFPAGAVDSPYSQTLAASGGSGSYTFAVTSGSLPAGLTLSTGGVLSGTPTAAGTSTFTVTAMDSQENTGSRNYTLVIAPAIVLAPTTLPGGTVGDAYSQTITASGGNATTFSFAVTSGSLPAGLTLAASGVLAGTPTTQGTSSFTVTATAPSGARGSRAYTLAIAPPAPLVLSPQTLPGATIGIIYVQPVSASGGNGSYTFRVTSGSLPAGIELLPNGLLTGIATANASTSTFTITASDTRGATGSRAYTLVVLTGVTITPSSLPAGTVGNAYSQQFTAIGGTGSYAFSVTQGALPAGLTLSPAGALTGTPTAPGTSTFTVTATDTVGASARTSYSIVVAQPIVVSPASLPAGTIGVPYNQTISASGGSGSFTFALTQGTLPAGLTLSPAGTLSGTPTAATTAQFTITATDSARATGSRPYTLTIASLAGIIAPASVQGNMQVVGPNTLVPDPFSAVVVDPATNQPKAGVAVTWTVIKGAGVLSEVTTISGSDGRVRARYTTGPDNVDNVVRVTATVTGSSFDFTVVGLQHVQIVAKQLIGPLSQAALTTPQVQLDNIRRHLDQLRVQTSPTTTNALRVSVDGRPLPPLSALELAPSEHGKKPTGGGASADKPDPFERWGLFVNGDIDIGKQSTVGTQTGFKLNTKGVTLGGDYRFEGNHVLGASVGFVKADGDLYGGAGSADAKGYSVSLYGTLVPIANAYVDGIVNIGRNRYDTQRQQLSGGTASGSPDGDQVALALNAGYAFNSGSWTVTPYGRLEHIDAKIDAFTETASSGETLSISEQRLKATTLTFGGQLSYAWSQTWGVLLPYARLEYQHVVQSSTQGVTAALIGSPSPAAIVPILGQDKSFGQFAVGASAVFPKGVGVFFDYEQLFGKENYSNRKYTLGVRVDF